MANLSSYTPIYIRTTGDDNTGDGSLESPYATAQKGFDIAIATPSGNYVLDFGSGSFGVVTLTQNWPSRIAVRGAGATVSDFSIVANGADAIYPEGSYDPSVEAQPGFEVSIISDQTVGLSGVTSRGGSAWNHGNAAGGGNITLTDCALVGDNAFFSANGGDNIYFQGDGGNGGWVTLSGCRYFGSSQTFSANGGYSNNQWHGGGGTVSLTDVTPAVATNLASVSANGGSGGNGGSGDYGKPVGAITITRSRVGAVQATGSNPSPFTSSYYSPPGGSITLTDSHATSADASGGVFTYNYNFPIHGPPGSISLVGSSTVPDSISGSVATSNLSKGRGVNGSSILGLV